VSGRDERRRAEYQQAVEYLCLQFAVLDEEFGGEEAWVRAVGTVRTGEPLSEPWYQAVTLLHDTVAARYDGGLGLTPHMGAGHWPVGHVPRSTGWLCPDRSCSRVELSGAGAGAAQPPSTPECRLRGRPMRFLGD
jgi:hypothetical protein